MVHMIKYFNNWLIIEVKRGGAPKKNDICSGTVLSFDGEGLPSTIGTSLFTSHGVYLESQT